MKKLSFLYSLVTLVNIQVFAQVGINTNNPQAELEIIKNNFQSNQNLLLNIDSPTNDNSIYNINKNGNMSIYNSLSPKDNAGYTGDLLVSNGADKTPEWKKNVINNVSIQVFSAEQEDYKGSDKNGLPNQNNFIVYSYHGTSPYYIQFPNIINNITEDIAVWDNNTATFTVNKHGIYNINSGINIYAFTPAMYGSNTILPFAYNIQINEKNIDGTYNRNAVISSTYDVALNPPVPIPSITYINQTDEPLVIDEPLSNPTNTLDDSTEEQNTTDYNHYKYGTIAYSVILKPGDQIYISGSIGGDINSRWILDKSYLSIVYTEIINDSIIEHLD